MKLSILTLAYCVATIGYVTAQNCFPCQNDDALLLPSGGFTSPEAEDDHANIPKAAISVSCQNINWTGLTTNEKSFIAAKLGRSFNDLMSSNNNPESLKHMSWESPPSSEHQEANNFKILMNFLWSQQHGHFWGDLVVEEETEHNRQLQNCFPCKNDDSLVLDGTLRGAGASEAEFYEDWARELEAFLRGSPSSALTGASGCAITMSIIGGIEKGY